MNKVVGQFHFPVKKFADDENRICFVSSRRLSHCGRQLDHLTGSTTRKCIWTWRNQESACFVSNWILSLVSLIFMRRRLRYTIASVLEQENSNVFCFSGFQVRLAFSCVSTKNMPALFRGTSTRSTAVNFSSQEKFYNNGASAVFIQLTTVSCFREKRRLPKKVQPGYMSCPYAHSLWTPIAMSWWSSRPEVRRPASGWGSLWESSPFVP